MKKRRSENADDTKQNKKRQEGLGLGYFERVKLSHSCN
ncbi:hypothetical protein T01_10619 [Trichinella spiralis]|uniref:Uncharacterized protein n=1 Tax=Trichinella spiralis TaxID=6334 RepID=A0A0V0YQ33_TRISP|nr:hypothetical protein T01_10619 [Trichinella spiralis]